MCLINTDAFVEGNVVDAPDNAASKASVSATLLLAAVALYAVGH